MDITEIKIKGKPAKVLSIRVKDRTIVTSGKWIRTASVHDEQWIEGQVVDEPELFISKLKESKLKADIFTFTQKLPQTRPVYNYRMEWDNVAAIPITRFEEWWDKRLPQVTRKNVRRGQKRGVVARIAEFDDKLVQGIVEIHNDTLIKQGAPNANYGKDFTTVKREYGTYLEKSEFLGAYHENELIGIIKLVYLGEIASIMQIVTKSACYDKRPTNVLIAKAVEVCQLRGISFLVYGKYIYGNKTSSSLMEFKRRNGFEQIDFPRYYVPLTLKGRIALKLKLHLGLLGILPNSVINFFLNLRSKYYHLKLHRSESNGKPQNRNANEADNEDEIAPHQA